LTNSVVVWIFKTWSCEYTECKILSKVCRVCVYNPDGR